MRRGALDRLAAWRPGCPNAMLSATVPRNSRLSWNTTPTLRRRKSRSSARTSTPSIRTRPRAGSSKRGTSPSSVLLPAPVAPDERHAAPGLDGEVDAVERQPPLVTEADALRSGRRRGTWRAARGVGGDLDLDRRVQHLEHAARGGHALLQRVDDGRHPGDLRRELLQQAREHDQLAERQRVARHQRAAVAEQDRDVERGDERDRRAEAADAPEDLLLLVAHRAVAAAEALQLLRLGAERLGDPNPLHALGHRQHHRVRQRAVLLVGGARPAREPAGRRAR